MRSWINGRAGDAIRVTDRGLHYGDGVFETMRVERRAVRLLDYHLDRLIGACGRLEIRLPARLHLRKEISRIAALRTEGVLKLIVTRGTGTRGYRPSGRGRCNRVIFLHAPSGAAPAARAARVRVCSMRLGINEALAGLKTLNRLESVVARAEWSDTRIWEGLMRDSADNFICGTMSNLFMRRGSRLMTPKLDRCGIAGVMRRWVLEQAGSLELSVTEGRLRWEDLTGADEIFMTNAVVGIVSVALVQHGQATLRLPQKSTAKRLRACLERL